ncbi:MAG: phosphoglucosamine mutase [Bacteroidales bacterium]|jgi:phosphomannomutase|nr:phosphoglucosamine mutase [Bacteroidales bacterium]
MTLIKSISGIRGTIGGVAGKNLTPIDIVKFSSSFASMLQKRGGGADSGNITMVVGRDGRVSGNMVKQLVISTLQGMGVNVIDVDLSTTPTVEMEVVRHKAQGGIIITASHNPKEWNALKLLGSNGEFISADEGAEVLRLSDDGTVQFAPVTELGTVQTVNDGLKKHIEKILSLPAVSVADIKKANFKIVVDGINSTGGAAISELLHALGVMEVTVLNGEPNGNFAHNPEPLPENLTQISEEVVKQKADMGIVVDPDVDRLCFVCGDGTMFGEEYTLVAVADYILGKTKGAVVSNLSSSRALRDVAEKYKCECYSSAVGEVNVVAKMKEVNAVLGGEGNGGVIYPELHYGRDALVGTALFLTALSLRGNGGGSDNGGISEKSLTKWRSELPQYVISKNKISLRENTDIDALLEMLKTHFAAEKINITDGVRIDFEQTKEWVHLRRSNTEPIIRIYAESATSEKAGILVGLITDLLN